MKWVSYTRSISSRIGEENPSNTIAEQNERIGNINQCIKTWAFDSGFNYANMFSCHVKLLSKGLLRDTSLFSGI